MSMKRVYHNGKLVNERTADMLTRAEARLGYELTIIQGSYNTSVGASGGTHDGGGAVDLSAYDWQRKVRVLRDLGFAAWYRPTLPGEWNEHIHAIAIGDPELSSAARYQVSEYYAGRNGLANRGADWGYRPSPIPVWVVELGEISLNKLTNQFETKNPEPTSAVKKVQECLNWRLTGREDLRVDGICGPKTKEAYYAWERKIGAADPGGLPGKFGLIKLVEGFHRVID
jgi:hypothetical protein